MRKCTDCNEAKPDDDYSSSESRCQECYNQKRRRKYKRDRNYIMMVKALSGCVDCDEKNPKVLDFDHRTDSNKKSSISRMARTGYSIETIKKEIDKCVVRCANCHRLHTAQQQGWYKDMSNLQHARLQTYTGKMFYPYNPKPEQIDIEDIAHSLSMQCRYNGHLDQMYSVAEHSVYTSEIVPEEHKLTALLHDAAEAYVGDLPSPIKAGVLGYCDLEQSIWEVISDKFGVCSTLPKEVKEADLKMLMAEKRDLICDYGWDWGIDIEPADVTISPVPPDRAKEKFLSAFRELTEQQEEKR